LLKTRKKIPAFPLGSSIGLNPCLLIYRYNSHRTLWYLGGPLSVVGTEYLANVGNANFYRLLVPGC